MTYIRSTWSKVYTVFRSELANLFRLVCMNEDMLDTSTGNLVPDHGIFERRDTTDQVGDLKSQVYIEDSCRVHRCTFC